jgi:hypothetical protein
MREGMLCEIYPLMKLNFLFVYCFVFEMIPETITWYCLVGTCGIEPARRRGISKPLQLASRSPGNWKKKLAKILEPLIIV